MAVRRERRALGEAGWGWTAFAGAISLIYFFPVLWIVLTAFKTHNDALAIPPKWLFTPTLENFAAVFSRAYSAGAAAVDTGFDLFFFNSIFIAGTSVLLALLFRTIEAFKLFDVVFLITDGGPGTSTETIAVYVYRLAFQYFRTSQSSALVYILLFIVIVLTNLYLYFVKRRAAEV